MNIRRIFNIYGIKALILFYIGGRCPQCGVNINWYLFPTPGHKIDCSEQGRL